MRAETLNVSTVPDGTSSGPVESVRGIVLSFALLKPLLAAAVRLSWPVPIGFVSPVSYTLTCTSKKVPTSSPFLRPTHTLAPLRAVRSAVPRPEPGSSPSGSPPGPFLNVVPPSDDTWPTPGAPVADAAREHGGETPLLAAVKVRRRNRGWRS